MQKRPSSLQFGLFFLIVFSILLGGGCRNENAFIPPPPPEVSVSRPVTQDVTEYAEFTGITEAVETVEIRARVAGYLESVHFKDGDRVNAGDLLFTIERDPYQQVVDQACAELRVCEAELELAEVTLQRKKSALHDNAVSEIDVITAQAARDIAAAAVDAARSAVEYAELNLSYTLLHAPICGTISRRLVDRRNLVGAGANTLLATIVHDDTIYVYFNVSERELLRFRQILGSTPIQSGGSDGVPLYVSFSDDKSHSFEGFLNYVDNRIDVNTGTIAIRGVLSNGDRTLLPGLFSRILVPMGEARHALLVPEAALGTDQQGRFVLLVKADNTVEYRPVSVGRKVDGLRVIKEGLTRHDRIVCAGVQRARPGATVIPVEAPVSEFEKDGNRDERGDR